MSIPTDTLTLKKCVIMMPRHIDRKFNRQNGPPDHHIVISPFFICPPLVFARRNLFVQLHTTLKVRLETRHLGLTCPLALLYRNHHTVGPSETHGQSARQRPAKFCHSLSHSRLPFSDFIRLLAQDMNFRLSTSRP